MRDELDNLYFNWMCQLVSERVPCVYKGRSYHKLLRHLHDTEFHYTLARDGDRYEDGIAFRYRFGYEEGFPDAEIASELDVYPCSVLEMMAALAFRCEEHLMWDPDKGDRTWKWFWVMIRNLGLLTYDDRHFDPVSVYEILDIFMERAYEPNGDGGLFRTSNPMCDMRNMEIWYQLNQYLASIT